MKVKKSFLMFGAVAVVAAGLGSCSGKQDGNDTSMAFRTMTGSAAYRLENTAKIYNSEHDITYADSATIVMPTAIYGHDITPLQNSIIKAAFDTVSSDHAAAMKSFFKKTVSELGYAAVESEKKDARGDADGLTIINGDVFNMSADLLTYRVTNYTYSPGAAHGMTKTTYITYKIGDGEIVTLDYLFTPDGLRRLPAIIRGRAEELAPALGRTDVTALPSMGNFYISLDDDIVFVYQPYEVASFAQGAIAVPFGAYQLADQMTPAGLRLFGLGE